MAAVADETAIRGLVDLFAEGWNLKDGKLCARPFAVDADFVNIMGLKAHGQEMIAQGHNEILSTVFRNTSLTAGVDGIRFIRPDVAVVDVTFTLKALGGGPFNLQKSMVGMVVTKEADSWSIISFRNMVPFDRPAAGPLERALTADTPTAQ